MAMALEAKPLNGAPLHILLIPFPAQGHFIPATMLAQRFASLGIYTTLIILKEKSEDLSHSNARSSFMANPLINTHYLEPSNEIDSSFYTEAGSNKVDNIITWMLGQSPQLSAQIEDFIQDLSTNRDLCAPCCIITDHVMSWIEDIATRVGMPWFLFYTSSATFLASTLQVPNLIKEGKIPIRQGSMDDLVHLPGLTLQDLRLRHMSTALREGSPLVDFLVLFAERARRASGMLINSFEEAETGGLQAINSGSLNPVPVYMVGPMIPDFRTENENECIEWLDSQRKASVLYISFGSVVAIPDEQAVEIAKGLEALKQPFLWVWRMEHNMVVEKLSQEFLERSQGYGRIVCGWAPQLQILQHSAIGAFLSHGGWNSCLESFFMGVPLLILPYLFDQMLDCKMVEEVLGVGLEIKKASNGIADHQEFEKAVALIMSDDPAGLSIRQRASLLSVQARHAAASTSSSLESFVKLLHDLHH